MSAGPFTRTFYQSDTGLIHPVRLQPETLLATVEGQALDPVTGPTTSSISAQVTGSRRGLGLFARYITVAFTGTPPTGYSAGQTYRLTVCDPAIYDAINVLDEGLYLTAVIQVVSKTPERIR